MKKKIETDIQNLAIDLLKQKESYSTQEWKAISLQLYERLCVLEYLESQLEISKDAQVTPPIQAVEELTANIYKEESSMANLENESVKQEVTEQIVVENLENTSEKATSFTLETKEEKTEEKIETPAKTNAVESEKPITQHPEKRQAEDLERFASTYKQTPVFNRKQTEEESSATIKPTPTPNKPKSLNDSLNRGLHIGLNDRIAFINHLFSGSTQDFNRVLSQINTMDDFYSVQNFLEEQIKPDYSHWEGKEEYSERFTAIIEKKFS